MLLELIRMPPEVPPESRAIRQLAFNRLETLVGILALRDGNLAGAMETLKRSGDALKRHTERRLQRPPSMQIA